MSPGDDDRPPIRPEDIPQEKIEKPGLIKGGFNVFSSDVHHMMAQSFAYGRQQSMNDEGSHVAGVALFDLDENNSIVVTYYKEKTALV